MAVQSWEAPSEEHEASETIYQASVEACIGQAVSHQAVETKALAVQQVMVGQTQMAVVPAREHVPWGAVRQIEAQAIQMVAAQVHRVADPSWDPARGRLQMA